MTGLTLNNLVDIHYTILVAFCFSAFVFSVTYRQLGDRRVHQATRLIGVLFFVAIQKIWVNDISLFKALMMGETIYFISAAISEFVSDKSSKQEVLSFFTATLLISSSLYLTFNPEIPEIYNLNLRWIAIAHIAAMLIDVSVKLLKHRPMSFAIPHLFNTLGSLTIIFLFNVDGLFFLIIFKTVYFISIHVGIWRAIQNYHLEHLSHARHIEKNFDNAVRKEVNERMFYMELSKEKIAKVARTDDMTGALNKKALLNEMDKLIADKRTHTYSVLMFDIDKFKNVNDTLGHIVGDRCIKTLARIAKESIRDEDFLGRYGGDEFFILLTGADIQTAVVVAERFRRKVAQTDNPHFTISVGISNYPDNGRTVQEIIHHADEGLYLSKEKGRNTVSYKST
ncbi:MULTISPECIES: GGDEF domain-containing protein [unclassified Fusibacter]|uniref:GGDEF domain-containing protein n=1 Tax=unclassified Fusibacter TaxID=2624464 RepID=UPI0010136A16|nr:MULTISPECIES: GGDEF domain-containing protein [unclassified Fusibacter]MCK8060994.1 GGDEF domain-containing protein [Fusibacter sp. A2]NPE20552.1 GGDEF domain-containing protein [Fusibacter sp. A1]RXV63749.1 GGDEF domain-containing protein [Fusibacter sp. A1]